MASPRLGYLDLIGGGHFEGDHAPVEILVRNAAGGTLHIDWLVAPLTGASTTALRDPHHLGSLAVDGRHQKATTSGLNTLSSIINRAPGSE
jgi:hypothetical protein